jgi:F-type H+-transporting ATPase subunit a
MKHRAYFTNSKHSGVKALGKLADHFPYALRQFETDIVVPLKLFGLDLSINTASTAKFTAAALLIAYFYYAMRDSKIVPGRLQASAEIVYSFVADTVLRICGPKGRQAIPFIFTVFVFVLFGTLLGLTPIKETFTSHIAVTMALALTVFAYANVLAVRYQGREFFRQFFPRGVPVFVAPVLIPVEVVSYLFRPITLGFRIFANIFAGHVMLKLFADFCGMLVAAFGSFGILAALVPMLVMVALYVFEVLIVCIQAYIFMLISTMYLRDAINSH